jgi:hypothetical protein
MPKYPDECISHLCNPDEIVITRKLIKINFRDRDYNNIIRVFTPENNKGFSLRSTLAKRCVTRAELVHKIAEGYRQLYKNDNDLENVEVTDASLREQNVRSAQRVWQNGRYSTEFTVIEYD